MGDLNISTMRIKEALSREARASGLFIPAAGEFDSETREDISQGVEAVTQSAPMQQLRSGVGNLQQQLPAVAAQAQQVVNPLRQAMRERMDPRVQAEQALLGGR